MKKVFVFSMVLLILASALWFNTGTAHAASSAIILYAPGASRQDASHAVMFADSNYQPVDCTLRDGESGWIVCSVNEKYAGESVRIYVAKQVFFVIVPPVRDPEFIPMS